MLKDQFDNSIIALSGTAQALALARDFADTGTMESIFFETSLNSLFETEPHDTITVFGSLDRLKYGLEKLQQLCHPQKTGRFECIGYLYPILCLEQKISRSQKTLAQLNKRIIAAKKQVAYFSLTHPTVISNLSDIYLDAIKHFRLKFLIPGDQRVLSQRANTDKIRALLLAAIRGAVLWRQMGGRGWQLLFSRAKIYHAVKDSLIQIQGK